MIREKKHRLPAHLYKGFVVVSFTACVKERVVLFNDSAVVHRFAEVLLSEAARFHCDVVAYLFMPDHLHVILQGNDENARCLEAMYRFKQRTGYWLSKNRPGVHWQKDYYDQIIRKEEEIEKHVEYILANPVRKGIVDNWKEYPFKGSTVYDLDELML